MPSLPRVFWVIPAYNEAASIVDLIDRIADVSERQGWQWHALVVDDGSQDGTGDLARQLATEKSLPVSVARNEPNRGLGYTIRRGLRAAARKAEADDVLITLDADLTQDPSYAPAMVARILDGNDVVIASRYQRGSGVEGLSGFRRALSRVASRLVTIARPIRNVRDYSCGFRAYRASAIQKGFAKYGDDLVSERGFACMLELAERLRDTSTFAEVPFVLHYQEKRKTSELRILPTVGAYFRVLAKVSFGGVSSLTPEEEKLVPSWLARAFTNQGARFASPAAATSLMYLFTRHYLVYFLPQLQLVLLPALVLGSIAEDFMEVSVSTVVLGGIAMAARPAFIVYSQVPLAQGIGLALVLALLAGVVASALVWVKRSGTRVELAAAALALLLVFVNMVATENMCDTQIAQPPFPPMYQYLKTVPVLGQYTNDTDLYLRTYDEMQQGKGYYPAFRAAFEGDASFGGTPTSPLNYRMPTEFWLWKLQPFGPVGIPETLLALDLIALVAFAAASMRFMRPAAAIVATTGMAAYLLYFLTTEYMLWAEAWALPFVIGSIAAAMAAEKSRETSFALWSISAGLAAMAMLMREQFLLLGIAGLATSLTVAELRARRIWIPWSISIAGFLALWLAHAAVAMSGTVAASGGPGFAASWLHGGPALLKAAVLYGNRFFSLGMAGPLAIVAFGVIGISCAPRTLRWFIGAAAVEGLALLSVFGNDAHLITGERMGYWGVFLVPYLLAALPFVLAALQSGATRYRLSLVVQDPSADAVRAVA